MKRHSSGEWEGFCLQGLSGASSELWPLRASCGAASGSPAGRAAMWRCPWCWSPRIGPTVAVELSAVLKSHLRAATLFLSPVLLTNVCTSNCVGLVQAFISWTTCPCAYCGVNIVLILNWDTCKMMAFAQLQTFPSSGKVYLLVQVYFLMPVAATWAQCCLLIAHLFPCSESPQSH